jgi:hypothetical protein
LVARQGYPGIFCVTAANTGLISARVKKSERAVLKQKELEYENFAGKRAKSGGKRVVALAALLFTADNITMVNEKSR